MDARLSIVRLLFVALVVLAVVVAGSRWALARVVESNAKPGSTWYAPYVDVTLPPALHFEDAVEQPSPTVVLGFIVADPGNRCAPSWGTYYDLDAAARALDLDRRVVRLRERGGEAVVSFGGALNDELAVACADTQALTAAYQAVIDRYELTTLDFDIEGAAMGNSVANARRSSAILALQRANPGLKVWFTLPVAPQGLTTEGVNIIDGLLAGGVELAGVNLMVMNYGGSRSPGASMGEASEQALRSTWQQLDGAYQRAGQPKSQAEIWRRLGATPMIGQNDVAGDVFTLKDAEALTAFASAVQLGRLSMWSANRDVQCGTGVEDARPSNTCSGVDQEPLEFAKLFGAPQKAGNNQAIAPAIARDETRAESLSRDDPRTSPYPLWRTGKAYDEGAKVVWQGRVYQAKWWTQGNQPDAPVKNTWDTPWRYLGPVLESDRAAVRAVAAAGERPRWSAETVYVAGNEVEFEGKIFKAKWWTQGNTPEEIPDQPYDHPWEFLGDAETP